MSSEFSHEDLAAKIDFAKFHSQATIEAYEKLFGGIQIFHGKLIKAVETIENYLPILNGASDIPVYRKQEVEKLLANILDKLGNAP